MNRQEQADLYERLKRIERDIDDLKTALLAKVADELVKRGPGRPPKQQDVTHA